MAREREKVRRAPARRDVELAQARAELATANASVEKWRYLGPALQGAAWIIACAVPLLALRIVIDPLAGKTTVVNANIIITVSLTFALAANAGQAVKLMEQRRTITRMRDRIQKLEDERLS